MRRTARSVATAPATALMLLCGVMTVLVVGPRLGDAAVPDPGPVLVYGDSLLEEAAPYVSGVRVNARGGSALCAWHDTIVQDAAALEPVKIAVVFSGNTLFDCGGAYARDDERTRAGYARDLARLRRAVAPTPVLWLRTPVKRTDNSVQAIPADVDAGAAVELPGRTFTEFLPSLSDESGELARVRNPDGIHFCPVDWIDYKCPVYSPGARRFGDAITAALQRSS